LIAVITCTSISFKTTTPHYLQGYLEVQGDQGSDYWRLSYYDPPFIHNSGHILGITTEDDVVVETTFSLDCKSQFDQAGLILYADEEHWIKVGIEYADGSRRLSSVITNEYSQWAVQVSERERRGGRGKIMPLLLLMMVMMMMMVVVFVMIIIMMDVVRW